MPNRVIRLGNNRINGLDGRMKSRTIDSLGRDQQSDAQLGGRRIAMWTEGVSGGWQLFQAQLSSWPRIPDDDG